MSDSSAAKDVKIKFRNGQEVNMTLEDLMRLATQHSTYNPTTNTTTVEITPNTLGRLGLQPTSKKG